MAFRSLRRKRDEPEDQGDFASEVDTVLAVLVNYAPGVKLSFGAPSRCPVCANFGLVEQIDPVAGRSLNRCVGCGARWVITARALRAVRTMVTPAAPPREQVGPSWDRGTDRVLMASGPEPLADGQPSGVLFSRAPTGEVNRRLVVPPTPLGASATGPGADPAGRRDEPMRILLIEDDPADIEVVRAILEPAGPRLIDLRTARTRAAGEAAALSTTPDLVLLDLGLPDSHGLATVTQWHFNASEAPVMIVSGEYGEDVVDRSYEFGVAGFMDKAELADLLALGDAGTHAFLDRLAEAAASP